MVTPLCANLDLGLRRFPPASEFVTSVRDRGIDDCISVTMITALHLIQNIVNYLAQTLHYVR
jgi:hypothetical protein